LLLLSFEEIPGEGSTAPLPSRDADRQLAPDWEDATLDEKDAG